MTDRIRILLESAVFWSDLAQQWRARGNMDAVAKCEMHEKERWLQIENLLNKKERED